MLHLRRSNLPSPVLTDHVFPSIGFGSYHIRAVYSAQPIICHRVKLSTEPEYALTSHRDRSDVDVPDSDEEPPRLPLVGACGLALTAALSEPGIYLRTVGPVRFDALYVFRRV